MGVWLSVVGEGGGVLEGTCKRGRTTASSASMLDLSRAPSVACCRRLARQGVVPAVLYPAVSIPPESELSEAGKVWSKELSQETVQFIGDNRPVFLSINRWGCAWV